MSKQTGTEGRLAMIATHISTRGGGGLRRLIVGVALAVTAALGQPAAGQGLEELRVRYPDVKAYHPHGRVLTVWGTAMTRGETPREAADEWVFWHGDVFGSTGGLDLEEFRDVKLRRAPEGKERRVFMYRQTMDIDGRAEPLAVVGSSFRVMTEGDPEGGAADVVYVAGRVATRPMGGLPATRVTPAEALAAAKAHERGRGLERWGEPELVAIYDDAPRGDGVAQPAWRVRGGGEAARPWTFYIDAVAGAVVRDHSSVMHFADEIQGTVTGNATPGTRPDIPVITVMSSPFYDCENLPTSANLPDAWVGAYDSSEQLVDSGFTDLSGDFSLDIGQSEFPVDVLAELKGPDWEVLDGSSFEWGDPIAPLAHTGNPVTAPASDVNLVFNPSPSEQMTAFVNAHKQISKTWRWLDLPNLPIDPLPAVPVVVDVSTASCNAYFIYPGFDEENPWPQGCLQFLTSSSICAHSSYATVVAHEYGHFIAWHLMGVDSYDDTTQAFHEGFADTLALLVFGLEVYSEDFKGCDTFVRWPRKEGIDHMWPMCPSTSTCSNGGVFIPHCIGELLAALWLDMRDEFGNATRDLFLDWMMIALVPPAEDCPVAPAPVMQSAGPTTLVEVLQVAGNQQSVVEAICNIFEIVREIPHPDPPCGDSAGWFCYADCDGNAVLELWDFLCFQEAFVAGDSYADCDGDEEFSFFDFLCFQNSFVAGCP